MNWLDDYSEALSHPSGPELDLTDEESRLMLKLAREVAHRSERVNAPLSTYLAGKFVAERIREGARAADAARDALRVAEEALPPTEDPAGS